MEKALKKKPPLKVKVGYTLIGIGSTLLLLVSVLAIILVSIAAFLAELDWNDPTFVADFVVSIIILVLYIASAIAGFNYISHRKFLVWLVAFSAIIFFIIFVYHAVSLGNRIYNGTWESSDISELVIAFVTQTIYFIGWWISKDYFED